MESNWRCPAGPHRSISPSSNFVQAFGPRAERAIAALPVDLPLLAFDEADLGGAYLAAVDRRVNAQPFFAMICVPEPRGTTALRVGGQIVAGRTYDQQRVHLMNLANGSLDLSGTRADTVVPADLARAYQPAREILRLADGLFAPSSREAERIANVCGVRKTSVAVAAAPRPGIPAFARSGRDHAIVVWAFGRPFEQTMVVCHALEEMRLPFYVITGAGDVFQHEGTPRRTDVADILACASVIVDVAVEDPFDALALAPGGAPLVVTAASGAAEYIDGAIEYDAWDWRSIYDAVASALGERPPRLHGLDAAVAQARATIARATEPPPSTGPLVSVIIPTYNRRKRLPSALRTLFAQQYQNLEVIVVNDGGDDVRDIVDAFPRARYITYETNGGVEHAINTGYKSATGAYITHISDDDAFYPDHIARLIDACERNGCAIAHGNTLMRFLIEGDGEPRLEGFAGDIFCFPLEKTEALWNSPVAGHAFVIRRDVGEALGWYDSTLPVLGDQEMQTRYSTVYDFAHVDHVTAEWRFVGGETNLSSRKAKAVPDAMEMWFANHPSDRPLVAANRAGTLATVRARPPGFRFPPSISFAAPPGQAGAGSSKK